MVESHSHLLGVDMDNASGQNANEDDVCETTDDGELDEHLQAVTKVAPHYDQAF